MRGRSTVVVASLLYLLLRRLLGSKTRHAGKRRVLLGGLIHDYYAVAT
jgi:hypothetical protein